MLNCPVYGGEMQNLPFVNHNMLDCLGQMAYLMDNTRCGGGYPVRILAPAAVCYGWAVCPKQCAKLSFSVHFTKFL